MKNPSQSKTTSQAMACEKVLAEILQETFLNQRPADRALAYCLKRNRQYGSRDRRLMAELVFAVFRWWGWLRLCLPCPEKYEEPPTRRKVEESKRTPGAFGRKKGLSRRDASLLLLGAAVLDHPQPLPSVVSIWARNLEIDAQACRRLAEDYPEPGQRFAKLAAMLNFDLQPDWQLLLPAWALCEPPLLGMERPTLNTLLPWLQRRPPVWIRAQGPTSTADLIHELEQCDISATPHRQLPRTLQIESRQASLYTIEPFLRGTFEIQDLASQLIGLICRPQPGQRWWDACAGAGGKTLQLADLLQGRGTVVATDIRTRKLDDLRKRARRAEFSNLTTRFWDGQPGSPKKATFQGVLIDAPCSCSGTWRRNPDARWTTRPEDLAELSELQLQILVGGASGVAPGGRLVYATCSFFERENQAVIDKFRQLCPDFILEPFAHPLTGEETDGTIQIWPWDGDCDAMFVACLRRG